MKNYKMINEAITVAENLLQQEKENYENYMNNIKLQIKHEISEYIYNLLKSSGFINIQGFKRYCECEICFDSGKYLIDEQNFQYQLFINTNEKVSRIYFNKEGYYEDKIQCIEEDTLIALINNWEYLKKRIPEEIDKAYQRKIKRIEKEANELKQKRIIFDEFKL